MNGILRLRMQSRHNGKMPLGFTDFMIIPKITLYRQHFLERDLWLTFSDSFGVTTELIPRIVYIGEKSGQRLRRHDIQASRCYSKGFGVHMGRLGKTSGRQLLDTKSS